MQTGTETGIYYVMYTCSDSEPEVLMREEKEGRKKQAIKVKQTKQHSTPKAVTFPKKNELIYRQHTWFSS